jgi:hypothetical protein
MIDCSVWASVAEATKTAMQVRTQFFAIASQALIFMLTDTLLTASLHVHLVLLRSHDWIDCHACARLGGIAIFCTADW